MAASVAYPGDLFEHLRALGILAVLVQKGQRGSFTRAAQALALDVSVLRRRVQTMEAFFGGPIFEGRGDSLVLTALGLRLAEDAERALALIARMQDGVPGQRGRLRIACTGTFLSEVLPAVLRDLKTQFKDLELHVVRRGSHASRELLRDGAIDFAIVRAETRPTGQNAVFVGADRLWLAIAKRNALSQKKRLTPALLAASAVVGYAPPSFTMDRVSRVLEPLGAKPWIEVQGKAAALAYAAEDLGVAFVSLLDNQKPAHRGVVMRDVTAMFSPASFWLVWKKSTLSPWEARFVERLRLKKQG